MLVHTRILAATVLIGLTFLDGDGITDSAKAVASVIDIDITPLTHAPIEIRVDICGDAVGVDSLQSFR